MNMDEKTGIKSTFATAQTLGITKEYLLETINHYKNILNKEKENFSIALKNKLDEGITGKREEGENLKKEIENLENKIKEYQKAIEQGKKRLANIDKDIDKVKSKVEATKDNFVKVISHLEEVINDDESKVNSIL
jgi:chromosome segregation ATPase